MPGSACGRLCFLLLLPAVLCNHAAPDRLRGGRDRQDPEEIKAAWGRLINQTEWEAEYDFVAILNITFGSGDRKVYGRCTGIVWKDKVLSAAHCGRGAVGWAVHTATHISGVSKVQVHPRYRPWPRRSFCHDDTEDFLLLTLTQPVQNRQAMELKSSGNRKGLELMLAGAGATAHNDTNPRYPPRPVVTDKMPVTSCPCDKFRSDCIGSGNTSYQSSCGGDSGSPWLRWSGGTAIVAGVNSFGYDGWCGHLNKKTGFWSTAAAQPWLEQVAPGHFAWSA